MQHGGADGLQRHLSSVDDLEEWMEQCRAVAEKGVPPSTRRRATSDNPGQPCEHAVDQGAAAVEGGDGAVDSAVAGEMDPTTTREAPELPAGTPREVIVAKIEVLGDVSPPPTLAKAFPRVLSLSSGDCVSPPYTAPTLTQ